VAKDGQLRWGVLSTSSIARAQVIPAINATPNCKVTAIASRDVARGNEVAATFGIDRVFPDYQSLIDEADIDVIYIPLPNSLHEEWAIKAAEKGIPTLCEKPLSTDAASAKRIVEAFERANVPLMEAFMYRFHPLHTRVKQLVREGVIGEVREVRAHLSTHRMEGPSENNIVLKPELGGGVLLDAGCYPVNVCRWMFDSEPLRATAIQDIDPRFGVDVTTSAIMEFGDGRIGVATSSHRAGGISFYTLVGTRGTIEVPRGFLPGWGDVIDEPLIIVTDGKTTERRQEVVPSTSQYQLMVRSFVRSVLEGTPVEFSPRDALGSLAAIDAIVASARSGRVEKVQAV
jgi:D-xylose 1-dehydrogenase (NADP+, D-xylono-1,5-lactone-forming)